MADIPISYPIIVMIFVAATAVIGILAVKFVKKSSKNFIVAGKSLPLFFVGTMLVSEAVDGNASLGNVALSYQFGFWAGAAIPLGLAICLVLTGLFFGRTFNRMNMITLADFYFRRYGNTAEIMSGALMSISFIILVAGNLGSKWLYFVSGPEYTADLCHVNFNCSSFAIYILWRIVFMCLHRYISYLLGRSWVLARTSLFHWALVTNTGWIRDHSC